MYILCIYFLLVPFMVTPRGLVVIEAIMSVEVHDALRKNFMGTPEDCTMSEVIRLLNAALK